MNARLTIATAALVLASGTAGVLTAELVEPARSGISTVAPAVMAAPAAPRKTHVDHVSADTYRILAQAAAANPTSECVAEWNEEQGDHEVICSPR